jgi:hypothetical protein
MSMQYAASLGEPLGLADHHHDAAGLLLSAFVPLVLAFSAMGAALAFGADEAAGVDARFAGDWLPALYLMLFPMWGAAWWFCRREGTTGGAAACWTAVLIAWGLCYPFLASVLDPFFLAIANLASVLLISATAVRVAPVSRIGLTLILPSLLWVALAALPGYVLLTSGWSPGFAITIKALEAGRQ